MQPELVIRARNGDLDAFATLTGDHAGRLLAVARLILRDEERAADVVQEALLRAWLDLRGLRDPERFEAWLHRILVRSCYRAARTHRRRDVVEITIGADDGPTVPDGAHDVDTRDQIERAFRRLSPEHRAVLVLHHYLGLTQVETADRLDIPLGTMQSRLDRATRLMRAALDADARPTALTQEAAR
jgi:RNA polymerase sigma-70 factor (ECF subfamily)